MGNKSVLNQILDLAQSLVQSRGYNAMSYRDLADAIGVKTSSIHYYFPSKEDLGIALLQRYRLGLSGLLASINADVHEPRLKLEKYVEIFVETVRSGKICLGGMFASDSNSLPESIQEEVRKFYTENEAWLAEVLKYGRDRGKFNFPGSPKAKAEAIFSALEGVMITARLFNDEGRLLTAWKWILKSLE